MRLFCFPYAGGAASAYRNWYGGALSGFEVCPVQLPGRERRINDVPVERIPLLVDQLAEVLPLDRPFAFFGHSMGALVAFELTRELRRRGCAMPAHLFFSGAQAPQLGPNRPPRYRLSREHLIVELRKLGGTPEMVLEDPELLDLVLPAIRADFALIDTYQYSHASPFTCPITVFSGEDDSEVEPFDVIQWRPHTVGSFRHISFPGDHFFITSSFDAVKSAIGRICCPG
jgi:surfactin synthase thioesterase subunit